MLCMCLLENQALLKCSKLVFRKDYLKPRKQNEEQKFKT